MEIEVGFALYLEDPQSPPIKHAVTKYFFWVCRNRPGVTYQKLPSCDSDRRFGYRVDVPIRIVVRVLGRLAKVTDMNA